MKRRALLIGAALALAASASSDAQQHGECTAGGAAANLDFTLEDMHGNDVTLSDYADDVILLDFWATWCAPCRIEIPGFIEMHDDYGDRGFSVLVVDKFEPITDAPVVAAEEVGVEVTDGELVLGVVLAGEARAYPINMLTGPEREVVNDTLGGRPIAATWCHLCNSAVVYDRRVDGRALAFAVSGMLWRRNLVMYDVETDSLWAQFNGKAMQGELIGTELDVLPGALTTWGEWRSRRSGTTVLDMSRTATPTKPVFSRSPSASRTAGICRDAGPFTSVSTRSRTIPCATSRPVGCRYL